MILNNLKKIFYKELSNLYPNQEIESFFYILTKAYTDLNRVDIALDPKYEIDNSIQHKFISALSQLKNEYPIQYIIGKTEFYGLPIIVNNNVLIPRPETEDLVKWVISEVKSQKLNIKSGTHNKPSLNILDIDTGSGCIAIALAKNLPNIKVWALDISNKAIEIAKENAKLNGVIIQFLNEDILNVKTIPLKFDFIISNPPYVKELEKKQIKNNVLLHEPHQALFVKDEDPLLFYNKIADLALQNLNLKGQLFFEINQTLGKETIKLLKEKGFKSIELRKDIFGVDRMIKAGLNK